MSTSDRCPAESRGLCADDYCGDSAAPDRDPLTEAIRAALGEVLWNASNYPRKAQPFILGQDTGPLRDKATDAVEAVIRAAQGTHRPPATPDQLTAIRELQQTIRDDLTDTAQDNNTQRVMPERTDSSLHERYKTKMQVSAALRAELAAARAEVAALRATQPTREQVAQAVGDARRAQGVVTRQLIGIAPTEADYAVADAILALYADPGHHA